jgi:photosystem II stability/assembly factor-like uncharacterized protein
MVVGCVAASLLFVTRQKGDSPPPSAPSAFSAAGESEYHTLPKTVTGAATIAGWTPLGLSGGGAMFAPAISPADPRRMMINCDMGAAYRSENGGQTWSMIPYAQLRSNTQCKPGFHPTNADIIFAASGGEGLKESQDSGLTWKPVGKGLPNDLQGEIALHPMNPSFMLVGAGEIVYRSADAGLNWSKCEGPHGTILGFHFDQTTPASPGMCFAATAEGIWRSDDGGKSWEEKTAGLPWRELLAFVGGSNAKESHLYCSVPRKEQNDAFIGGIYESTDHGELWKPVIGNGLNLETKAFDEYADGPVANYHRLFTSNVKPSTVYAFNSNTGIPPPHHASCYKSEDGGRTWKATFQADPRYPGRNVERDYVVVNDGQFYQEVPLGIAGNPNDPNLLLTVTTGQCFITRNGGKSWELGHTYPATVPADGNPKEWMNNGLVVTSTWNYYIDPFQPNRHYICYTDSGFARSLNAGKTWSWWTLKGRAPWRNTCYQLAFDPEEKGRIWGAFSEVHDIPNGNIIEGRHKASGPGGVCVSADYGETWEASSKGLPKAPCTSVVVDPKSQKESRVLYAGVFGGGVFRSEDGGKSWESRSEGLGSETNRRVNRVLLHPDGTLFASVTGLKSNGRFQAEGVGLYRSRDQGKTWEEINRSQPLLWPKDFTVDFKDSHILYLSAADADDQEQGGLYRSADGGATWKRLAREGPQHFGAYLSPFHAGWIYMTLTEDAPGAGLWLSKDNGQTWKPMAGLPFNNAQRVAFDPKDAKTIYVTTFGGSVWKGPAEEP